MQATLEDRIDEQRTQVQTGQDDPTSRVDTVAEQLDAIAQQDEDPES